MAKETLETLKAFRGQAKAFYDKFKGRRFRYNSYEGHREGTGKLVGYKTNGGRELVILPDAGSPSFNIAHRRGSIEGDKVDFAQSMDMVYIKDLKEIFPKKVSGKKKALTVKKRVIEKATYEVVDGRYSGHKIEVKFGADGQPERMVMDGTDLNANRVDALADALRQAREDAKAEAEAKA